MDQFFESPLSVLVITAIGIVGIFFAFYLKKKIDKINVEDKRAKELQSYIQEGAKAFMKKEYITLSIFTLILFVIVWLGINIFTAICFLCGALLSALAGYLGMSAATSANARTAEAAKKYGMGKALSIAFSGGSIMGLSVVSLGLGGLSLLYLLFFKGNNGSDLVELSNILTGFGLGASSIALFSRVGGGVYTKAADVGADLVGKVEAGIPEDDPRNPAVIADNVGDNVGDVAGMGADLFESYVGAMISAISLGAFLASPMYVMLPMLLSGIGIISSIIGSLFVKGDKDPAKSLRIGTYVASGLVLVCSLLLSILLFKDEFYKIFICIAVGLIVGVVIGRITEIYTSADYKYVNKITEESKTGSATNIIGGLSIGMLSTTIPTILICVGIIVSYYLCDGPYNSTLGVYGISMAAIGMLSTTGITVAVDAYGPIADNAGGIAEMAGYEPEVREITDKLDAVGNTTAAMGKGFAIGSAALTSLALFVTFIFTVQDLTSIDITVLLNLSDPCVVVGLFIGGMLPFLFSALTMDSVGRAANKMIEEVRRQFKADEGILKGTSKPDYAKCVTISTGAALKEMILPGVLAIVCPLLVGIILGYKGLSGLLAGSLVTGVLLAIFMSNAGGAWDNAKKLIEERGFKGTDTHKASVVGDTVGDPFKDTCGPSLNILVKLMSIVSVVFIPLFMKIVGGLGLIGFIFH